MGSFPGSSGSSLRSLRGAGGGFLLEGRHLAEIAHKQHPVRHRRVIPGLALDRRDAGDLGVIVQGGNASTLLRVLERLGLADVFGRSRVPLYVMNVAYPVIPEEIVGFCRLHLAAFKVPRQVAFRDELPKSMVGKYLRRVLVEEERAKQREAIRDRRSPPRRRPRG